jgi:predicted Zn-dependent protease
MKSNRCLFYWILVMVIWATPLHALNPTAPSMSENRLWRLAAQEQATLRQSGNILNDASLADYLQALTTRLWEQADSELNRPVVDVIMDTGMDAYTYPNGYIVLTTGMLDEIRNEDQLAMILAHEMVHYARQHAVAFYDQSQHHRNPFSPAAHRIDVAENQADREGLTILKRAGYCPAEVLVLMSNLMTHISDMGASRALDRMTARRRHMETLIEPASTPSSCTDSIDESTSFYLNVIAPCLIANAQTALRHGDWNLADKSISRFIAINPEDARAYYLRGEITRRRNDGEESGRCIGFYETALEIDPGYPLAHRALGEVHFKAGRYQMAKPHFEAFLNLAPQDDASEFIKGYLLQCQ